MNGLTNAGSAGGGLEILFYAPGKYGPITQTFAKPAQFMLISQAAGGEQFKFWMLLPGMSMSNDFVVLSPDGMTFTMKKTNTLMHIVALG